MSGDDVIENGQRRRLKNEKNVDLYRLYDWTVPPVKGSPTDVQVKDVDRAFLSLDQWPCGDSH
jgi:hypothetical protein